MVGMKSRNLCKVDPLQRFPVQFMRSERCFKMGLKISITLSKDLQLSRQQKCLGHAYILLFDV